MVSVNDVPTANLIDKVAADFKVRLEKPAWTSFVKSGSHRERAPHNSDWYFVRMASILYRVYKDGPVGSGNLRTYYGGRKSRGVKPPHFRKASGKVIRVCLQALEKEGLIKKAKVKGREISPKGHKYLAAQVKEIEKELKENKHEVKEKVVKKISAAEQNVRDSLNKMENKDKVSEKKLSDKKQDKSDKKHEKTEQKKDDK